MTRKTDIRAEADRLRVAIEARGAEIFEADILQPAGALLDLYGEDIRARAFVTHDPLQGEMMLRPDFTVPLVQRHMAEGRDAARYSYAGEVFRRQEDGADRAVEYMQVGYEVFGETPAEADAEVFATFMELLAPLNLRAAIGDIGLLQAAVSGLQTSAVRKAALMRHLWRPRRFKSLLTRFSNAPRPVPDAVGNGVVIGLRGRDEVEARLNRLRSDFDTLPLAAEDMERIDALLNVRDKVPAALTRLAEIASEMPAIAKAITALETRLKAMAARGVPIDTLDFEASYGRTTLEYYDGFVFGFYADARADLPPVATGGRYDALTRALGGDDAAKAVGGVIRPGVVRELASC